MLCPGAGRAGRWLWRAHHLPAEGLYRYCCSVWWVIMSLPHPDALPPLLQGLHVQAPPRHSRSPLQGLGEQVGTPPALPPAPLGPGVIPMGPSLPPV